MLSRLQMTILGDAEVIWARIAAEHEKRLCDVCALLKCSADDAERLVSLAEDHATRTLYGEDILPVMIRMMASPGWRKTIIAWGKALEGMKP